MGLHSQGTFYLFYGLNIKLLELLGPWAMGTLIHLHLIGGAMSWVNSLDQSLVIRIHPRLLSVADITYHD